MSDKELREETEEVTTETAEEKETATEPAADEPAAKKSYENMEALKKIQIASGNFKNALEFCQFIDKQIYNH